MALTQAERLLQELGVTEPGEIDLEAIAYHVNARVRYRPLDGCEARIVVLVTRPSSLSMRIVSLAANDFR